MDSRVKFIHGGCLICLSFGVILNSTIWGKIRLRINLLKSATTTHYRSTSSSTNSRELDPFISWSSSLKRQMRHLIRRLRLLPPSDRGILFNRVFLRIVLVGRSIGLIFLINMSGRWSLRLLFVLRIVIGTWFSCAELAWSDIIMIGSHSSVHVRLR